MLTRIRKHFIVTEKEFLDAVKSDNLKDIRKYISSHKRNPAALNVTDQETGDTALIIAVSKKHSSTEAKTTDVVQVEVINELIRAGIALEHRNNIGMTALLYAAFHAREDFTEKLIEAKADVNIKNAFDCTALMCAAENNSPACVSLLLKHGANVNAERSFSKTTSILYAIKNAIEDKDNPSTFDPQFHQNALLVIEHLAKGGAKLDRACERAESEPKLLTFLQQLQHSLPEYKTSDALIQAELTSTDIYADINTEPKDLNHDMAPLIRQQTIAPEDEYIDADIELINYLTSMRP